ncbi:MAG: transcriptional regulator with XRE-family HTH domain [Yoonia sp.]|jgi:transcriptional regulator with XRE-family HTH domain
MTDKADAILSKLPAKLKSARQDKSLSLDAVSKLSGVSKSMLSQIERGESSPTISTLWNLTRALQVDFAGLLEGSEETSKIAVLRSQEVPTITVKETGCHVRILSPPEDAGSLEVYELAFENGGVLDSQPHSRGTREHLTVIEGSLTITSGEVSEALNQGDTGRYAGDISHAISSKDGARAILIVINV